MSALPPVKFEPVIFSSEPVTGQKRGSPTEHPPRPAPPPIEPVIWQGPESSPPPPPLSGRSIRQPEITDLKFKRTQALLFLETNGPSTLKQIWEALKTDFPKLDEAATERILQNLLKSNCVTQLGTLWSFVEFEETPFTTNGAKVWTVIKTINDPTTTKNLRKKLRHMNRNQINAGLHNLFFKRLVTFTTRKDSEGKVTERTWLPSRLEAQRENPPIPPELFSESTNQNPFAPPVIALPWDPDSCFL